jgi:hypothetical protein
MAQDLVRRANGKRNSPNSTQKRKLEKQNLDSRRTPKSLVRSVGIIQNSHSAFIMNHGEFFLRKK